jgi:hypothetical protein
VIYISASFLFPEPTVTIADRASGEKLPIRILSASLDSGLNRSRALLLRHYGFDVTTSESKEHAREQIERSRFDVLIFGNTLPQDTCWELAAVFRRHNSKGKIIEIVPSPWAAPKNQPDFSVVGTAEPDQLISTIRRTLP